MNQKRPQKSAHRLDFQALETRNLLASVTNTVPLGTNLVVNGDFADAANGQSINANNPGNFFESDDVTGWATAQASERIKLVNVSQGDRDNVLELDATAGAFDRVFQTVDTTPGTEYILSFELRSRETAPSPDATSNQVEVFWNNESAGVFTADGRWNTIAVTVVGGDLNLTRLAFHEVSNAGSDGAGPLIDNVRLIEIDNSTATNGDFSTTTGAGPIFTSDNVEGWQAGGDAADQNIRIEDDGGDNFLNLDTGTSQIDRVYQDFTTETGQRYYVTFDLRGSAGQPDAANELRIRWNDDWAGTFQGTDDWTTHGVLLEAEDTTSRLVFREAIASGGAAPGTGDGPQIDNVQIRQITTNAPLASVNPADRNDFFSEAPEMTINQDLDYSATIELESGGEIVIDLFEKEAPLAVNNFVNLANVGWFDGLFFNRVIDNFVAQAGGPFENSTSGGPGYTFADETSNGLNFDGTGQLAMANSGPNTNGSQFFITYAPQPGLNGDHTIFGAIDSADTVSFNALDGLTRRDPITNPNVGDIPADVISKVTINVTNPNV